MSETTTFVARTALGAPIATFAERSMALTWAELEGDRFPGWSIAVVTERTITTTRVLRRDRSHLREAA